MSGPKAETAPVPKIGTASPVKVSRRSFVGLVLGALASVVAACRPGGAPDPAPTWDEVAVATSTNTAAVPSPSPSPPPTETSIPATVTATPTAVPPEATPTGAGATPATATPSLTPTYTPVPATPTSPPPPTATLTPALTREALLRHWPDAEQSRVVVVRHSGVWAGDQPDPAVVLHMLDEGLRTLAGAGDAQGVWRALFEPHERVLLKVNCIAYGGPTQPAVTYAVAQRLQEAGLSAENILIFDRTDRELESAGYRLNGGGGGVQCHGASGKGSQAALSQATVKFFQELDDCDALINVPTPKQHDTAGISVALKNHYGSVDRPGSLHGNFCDPAIAELNAQPNIRDKTRLIVGAALNVSPRDWNRPERENALLLSFDPVAHDTVARDILIRRREAQGLDSGFVINRSSHLRTAQELGLGATDPGLIELQEVVLA
jgi:hypothetical protein